MVCGWDINVRNNASDTRTWDLTMSNDRMNPVGGGSDRDMRWRQSCGQLWSSAHRYPHAHAHANPPSKHANPLSSPTTNKPPTPLRTPWHSSTPASDPESPFLATVLPVADVFQCGCQMLRGRAGMSWWSLQGEEERIAWIERYGGREVDRWAS